MFVYRDVPYRGSFRCSDARLNAIYDTAAYTCHLCLQNRLWDGIKRDRLVWIGDTHPEMLAIRTLFGREPLLEQSLDTACGEAPLPRLDERDAGLFHVVAAHPAGLVPVHGG